MDKALQNRIIDQVDQLQIQYPTAMELLKTATNEAMIWAVPFYTSKKVPSIEQLERLSCQLLAIVDASLQKSEK